MAERKQTPDILSEILAGGAASPPTPSPRYAPQEELDPNQALAKPKAARKTAPKTTQARKTGTPTKDSRAVPEPPTQWEYRVVSFQEHHGWRPRFVDGVERRGWTTAPLLHETLADLAQEGWELVTATSGEALYGAGDKRQLYFRRPLNRA
jgi:phosphoglycolate phosphatase-like HAD superfamily hydrolase